ncbi:MAG: hypothetical protein AAFV98_17605 [Chloroflexota bacterium]
MPNKNDFIEAMAKHLPPSAADLRLLDIGGVASETLLALRPDIDAQTVSLLAEHWSFESNTVDAVVGYDIFLKPTLLASILDVMRPGGRFTIVNPSNKVDEKYVVQLESAGYTRILVEPAVGNTGVLIRGEKPHTTADTHERVQDVATRDADLLDLATFRGRFVHLLVVQLPNKPVWKLDPDDTITWQAVAIKRDNMIFMLGFSSLPKAVGFMQPAVVEGIVKDVNKVGKFTKAVAQNWEYPVLLNPTLDSIRADEVMLLDIDPDTAEAPDE